MLHHKIKTSYAGLFLIACFFWSGTILGQVEERQRPEEWENLVKGGKFIDLFQPIPPIGQLTSNTWGKADVVPRYIDNGIEDNEWSYWGGNILKGEDGKFHMYVCRWREDSPKGHHEWPNSIVVHAESDSPMGPFRVVDEIGKGHNPEIYKTDAGDYVLYVIDGRYSSRSLYGPWEYSKYEFDQRDRPIIEGLSNLTFAKREDGSYLMVCRGGGVWFSKDGLSAFYQVTDKRVYPPVDGRFEDPVVWRDNIQYHLIVNDWLGRIAFYLRSKDGVHWKTDPGEAYMPGITIYEDGTAEDWFKYERIKIFQDGLGRATQANFAVIDTLKNEDKPNDSHSSKNIGIPLAVGLQLELLNKKPITRQSNSMKLLVKAERGFNPLEELDLNSLHFGTSEEVDFGKGAKVKAFKAKGDDLLITFEGLGNGFKEDDFVGKLIGKNKDGQLVFGYSRLPWVDYNPAILSTRKPVVNQSTVTVPLENFGQVKSKSSTIKVWRENDGEFELLATGKTKSLKPFELVNSKLDNLTSLSKGETIDLRISVTSKNAQEEIFEISTVVE
ncbi:glycoside hydrolase family protein [Algoriphagus sp. AGSA1]|uniref:glycoside hydrolase family protein n=1 Tax=Algoriphagus sp. AGSA1 TaxID=2907213 RepID=UPI001F45225D|nr:glycoside hydrolase family protein [Algoriphagus sp. AGSA1]MCE7053159.1 glycoside hydrolase family protein [Algoriphagus sp. AGSA1]